MQTRIIFPQQISSPTANQNMYLVAQSLTICLSKNKQCINQIIRHSKSIPDFLLSTKYIQMKIYLTSYSSSNPKSQAVYFECKQPCSRRITSRTLLISVFHCMMDLKTVIFVSLSYPKEIKIQF